jgi:hypothetical protein
MVIPFVRAQMGLERRASGTRFRNAAVVTKFGEGVCLPGSEWLYVALRKSAANSGDASLRHTRAGVGTSALVRLASGFSSLQGSGLAPEASLSVRFERTREQAFGPVNARARLQNDATIWRVQYDTYYREIERFGGARHAVSWSGYLR